MKTLFWQFSPKANFHSHIVFWYFAARFQKNPGFSKTRVFQKTQPTGVFDFIGFWALGFSDFFI